MKNRLWIVSVTIDSVTTIVTVLAPSVKRIHSYFGRRNALVWDDLDAPSGSEPDFDLSRPLGLPEHEAILVVDGSDCIPSFLAS